MKFNMQCPHCKARASLMNDCSACTVTACGPDRAVEVPVKTGTPTGSVYALPAKAMRNARRAPETLHYYPRG